MSDVVNLASVHKGICDVIKTIMYSHIVELPEELQEKVSNRLNDLHKRIDEQDEDVQTLFKGFEEELMEDEDLGEEFLDVLFPYLDSDKILRMADMMAGPVGRFARYILSASYYELFLKFLQIEEQCAFSVYGTCVPAGGKRPLLHMNAIDWAIKVFFALDALGWDDEEVLDSCVIEESGDGEEWYMPNSSEIISEWLTVKLVSGHQKMIDFMLKELEKEDYSYVSCQIFITPILKSANLQLLQSTVNLFLHQEDYFESFVSQVFKLQLGIAPESMMFLIDSMKENEKLNEIMAPLLYNMLFPKIELESEEDSHGEILNLAADCLRNPELRQQLLTDSHPQKVYVALWAIGFHNTDEAWVVANQLIKEGRSMSKEVVLSYYQNHWAKESLEVITQRINQQK
ncbi:MAG: hypothetical protein J6T52_13005 [Bacteroidaceae bacterium]|nr:hypothetical protein [Bacteroidaceae bacterium]